MGKEVKFKLNGIRKGYQLRKVKPLVRFAFYLLRCLIILYVLSFLLFQQAVQSTILFFIRTIDKILQTCSVVKNSASTAATIQTDMAVSDIDAILNHM